MESQTGEVEGRLLAVGDVHGQVRHLEVLLEAVDVAEQDRLILLGDYVDGGPHAARVLDIVQNLLTRPQTVALRGNHDEVLVNALDDPSLFEGWARSFGPETVRSYGLEGRETDASIIDQRHGGVLRSLRLWHEEPEAIFVHGSVDPDFPMAEQESFELLWEKMHSAQRPHVSGKIIICGHSAYRNGLPRDFGGAICIDTNAKDGDWLTCLDILARRCWQAKGTGERRAFSLGQDPG